MWFIKQKYNLAGNGVFKRMTDVHAHLLWGVDDGAKDERQSYAMIEALKSFGIRRSFATPHIMAGLPQNEVGRLTAVFNERLLPMAGELNFEVRLAGEYMLDEAFLPKIQCGEKLLTYDGRHLLIEMSHLCPPPVLEEMLFEIKSSGYIPVLAHPERYGYFSIRDFEILKDRGCLFQMNVLSLSDAYGRQVRKASGVLLDARMYNFLGTDIHRSGVAEIIGNITITKKVWRQVSDLIDANDKLWA